MNKTHMGNALKEFLKSRRIKNSECAEFLEITRPTFRKIIDSEIISYTIICKLQKFLNYDFNFYSNKNLVNITNKSELEDMEYSEILILIYDYLNASKTNNFNDILLLIKKEFDISNSDFEAEEDHSIGNLCLLDQGTNRGYKNAIFPIKRQTIINNDLKGIYILPMTKSVFLKQFSGRTKNLLVWTENDSAAYQTVIINQINQN